MFSRIVHHPAFQTRSLTQELTIPRIRNFLTGALSLALGAIVIYVIAKAAGK